jgi:hypothetical protein
LRRRLKPRRLDGHHGVALVPDYVGEASARAWLATQRGDMARVMRNATAFSFLKNARRIEWHPPRPLPKKYA